MHDTLVAFWSSFGHLLRDGNRPAAFRSSNDKPSSGMFSKPSCPLTAFPRRVMVSSSHLRRVVSSPACDLKNSIVSWTKSENEVVSIKGPSPSLHVFLLTIPPNKHPVLEQVPFYSCRAEPPSRHSNYKPIKHTLQAFSS